MKTWFLYLILITNANNHVEMRGEFDGGLGFATEDLCYQHVRDPRHLADVHAAIERARDLLDEGEAFVGHADLCRDDGEPA